MKRTGSGAPLARCVPCGFSIASRGGRAMATVRPETIPRSMVRRLNVNLLMVSPRSLIQGAGVAERFARHDLDEGLFQAITARYKGSFNGSHGLLLSLGLDMAGRVPVEVAHDAR